MHDPSNDALPLPYRGPSSSRVDRLDHPRPGQYWRLTRSLKHLDELRFRGDRSLAVGMVVLLIDVQHADGADHVYIFAPHPAEAATGWDNNRSIHAEDLWAHFEPAPDAEAVRAAELADLAASMEQAQRDLVAGPPAAPVAGLLAQQPSLTAGGTGQELATREGIQAMTQFAEASKQSAQAMLEWVESKTQSLGRCAKVMARFHAESAEAMKASIHGKLAEIEALLRSVGNLQLYTGEGVDIMLLRDGAPAGAGERITAYQERLSLDEETLILVDAGGADHRHVNEVAAALSDPDLLQRLIPSSRGMVLCQFRSTYKEFIKPDGMAAAMVNSAMNAASQLSRILLRDGDRLYLISADFLAKAKQLLPSTGEQNSYYTDRAGERISPESIDYAAAQTEQVARLNDYARVLICLWGLRDRGEILAESEIPIFTNWLDASMQARWLALVSHDDLLGEERQWAAEWQRSINAGLAPGCRVAIHTRVASTTKAAPGMFGPYNSFARGHEQHWDPIDPVVIATAKKSGAHLTAEIPCAYAGYGETKNRERMVRVRLDLVEGHGILVLDSVSSADLDYYLSSRRQRQHYAGFVTLFRVARIAVREREATEAGFMTALAEATRPWQRRDQEPATHQALASAMSAVRASARSRTLPAPSDARFDHALSRAAAIARDLLVGPLETRLRVQQLAEHDHIEPLRLSRHASGELYLYAEGGDAENDPRLLHQPVFCKKYRVLDQGLAPCAQPEPLQPTPTEQVLHDWPTASDWARRVVPGNLTHDELHSLLEVIRGGSELLVVEESNLNEVLARIRRRMLGGSGGMIGSHHVMVPIGCVGKGPHYAPSSEVLMAKVDPLAYIAQLSEASNRAVIDLVERTYRSPGGRLSTLDRQPVESWCFGTMRGLWKNRARHWLWAKDLDDVYYAREAEVRDRGVLCLSEAGAKLAPELIELCKRPL